MILLWLKYNTFKQENTNPFLSILNLLSQKGLSLTQVCSTAQKFLVDPVILKKLHHLWLINGLICLMSPDW